MSDTNANIWAALAAPIPLDKIEWRQDGKATERDGKSIARFVCYMTAQYARERLDSVAPGNWSCTIEHIAAITAADDGAMLFCFKASVTVIGVVRQDVGEGSSPKGAATDAFKRACMRFGMAHELYGTEHLWVEVESGKKYPKPLEDPAVVYARKKGLAAPVTYKEPQPAVSRDLKAAPTDYYPQQETGGPPPPAARRAPAPAAPAGPLPKCPVCDGALYDNRVGKRNPKAPDFKCRDRRCDGVVWEYAKWAAEKAPVAAGKASGHDGRGDFEDFRAGIEPDDDLPFRTG